MGVECLYRRGMAGRPRGATGPLSRLWSRPTGRPRGGGDRPPLHARAPVRDLVTNLKKKITFRVFRPHRATGGIFEIFQNGYIFLKF
jgi:hypothetical protein